MLSAASSALSESTSQGSIALGFADSNVRNSDDTLSERESSEELRQSVSAEPAVPTPAGDGADFAAAIVLEDGSGPARRHKPRTTDR